MLNINLKIIKPKILLVVAIFILNNSTTHSEEVKFSAKKCDLLWFEMTKKYGRNKYRILLREWVSISPKCNGTGIYEFRLGSIYKNLGYNVKFKDIINKGLALDSSYNHYLKVSKLTILLNEAATENRINNKLKQKLVKGYENLIKSNKNWITPYESLTNIYMLYKNPDKIIFYANKSLELNKNSFMGHFGLVVGNLYKKNYKEARNHIKPAASNNKNLFSNIEFMCASAWVYASLNEHEIANAVLNRLNTENPRAKETDRMKRTYFYAKKRYEESLNKK